jgi:hypothetical protein
MENDMIEEFYDERLNYCSLCHMNPCQCDEVYECQQYALKELEEKDDYQRRQSIARYKRSMNIR